MRTKYMYYLLKKNFNTIRDAKLKENKDKLGNVNYYQIEDWQNVLSAFLNISLIPYIKPFIDEILSLNVLMIHKSDIEIFSNESRSTYINLHNSLINKMKIIIDFYETAGFSENQYGFDIKLPPTNDFVEFSKSIKTLEKILINCPYLKNEKESIKIKKVDNGSTWLEFAVEIASSPATAIVATPILLMNLSKIVDKCVKIKSHILSCKQQEEQLKTMNIKNELLEELTKSFSKITENFIEERLNDLKSELGELKDGEDEERVRKNLKDLTDLMQKGLKIYSSIDSPKEIRELFPTSDELIPLPEPIKLIKENKSE